ncbi:hypothetical protein WUBG_00610 [Wuchereria bancrofti]|uniref:Uncharacterized protein n=1 Tax=Wuchereria bancrofti TaxID=6293 RepID=J9FFR2_WUCBA|nr:hypothetical protein WUBG_00610 [Wuchereria bancrofti]VDM13179.1 unnamed protein product [Wuchereria bancrofti]
MDWRTDLKIRVSGYVDNFHLKKMSKFPLVKDVIIKLLSEMITEWTAIGGKEMKLERSSLRTITSTDKTCSEHPFTENFGTKANNEK